ncbi:tetratricopeptide repeat protein [Effusibacillus pohliae]|uniref:tetratricopeptide repeat protein n=1 Tax=Effusibacillus pohliae TaxID=232270 RepID=UPI0003702A95|nr:hypothetical protein [Effusibacillus pohliae]
MKIVCFGTAWQQDSPCHRLLQLLPECDDPLLIPDVPLSRLESLDPNETVAFVFHPYWIQVVNRFAPRYLVSYLEPCPEGCDRSLWEKCSTHLAARSTVVCTQSERIYLEQCFRRDSLILLSGEERKPFDVHQTKDSTLFLRDYEVAFRDAMNRMIHNLPMTDVVQRQWRWRTAYYRSLLERADMRATVCFLLSVYLYLLKQPEAREHLLQSFESALLAGDKDCLTTHYRFLSAIEAQAGELEKAVHVYGITALLPHEKQAYCFLLSLLEQGKYGLVQAEIFRLNEDYKSAAAILRTLASDDARRILCQVYLHLGQLEEALRLIEPADLVSLQDRRDYCILNGTVRSMIYGNRHAAIHWFLQAATYDYQAIAHILECKALDDGLAACAKEVRPDDPEIARQPVDGDAAGSE